jgi:tetratricopeptide (TPR) repeat protein
MDPALADIVEEARFYISQSMVEEARMALGRAEIMSPGAPQIAELQAQLATLPSKDPQDALIEILSEVRPIDEPADAGPPILPAADLSTGPSRVEPASRSSVNSEPGLLTSSGQAGSLSKEQSAYAGARVEPLLMPGVGVEQGAEGEPSSDWQARERSAVVDADAASRPVAAEKAAPPGPAQAHIEPPAELSRAAGPNSTQPKPAPDAISEFVLELEESLGEDFVVSQPGAATSPQHGPETPSPVPTAELASNEISDESAGLNGLFTEFKRDLESSSAENDDPETHYNLGVAFKEMGLLDEAIGEFQKVCKAIENGPGFPQTIQVYTWLADCFVQNGLPEAGIHWYEKALQVPDLDGEGVLAIHYELARAHEAAGDLSAARRHFMHVLSRNIDYRDVAERIKALKS